jgi:hypothetical protein
LYQTEPLLVLLFYFYPVKNFSITSLGKKTKKDKTQSASKSSAKESKTKGKFTEEFSDAEDQLTPDPEVRGIIELTLKREQFIDLFSPPNGMIIYIETHEEIDDRIPDEIDEIKSIADGGERNGVEEILDGQRIEVPQVQILKSEAQTGRLG